MRRCTAKLVADSYVLSPRGVCAYAHTSLFQVCFAYSHPLNLVLNFQPSGLQFHKAVQRQGLDAHRSISPILFRVGGLSSTFVFHLEVLHACNFFLCMFYCPQSLKCSAAACTLFEVCAITRHSYQYQYHIQSNLFCPLEMY